MADMQFQFNSFPNSLLPTWLDVQHIKNNRGSTATKKTTEVQPQLPFKQFWTCYSRVDPFIRFYIFNWSAYISMIYFVLKINDKHTNKYKYYWHPKIHNYQCYMYYIPSKLLMIHVFVDSANTTWDASGVILNVNKAFHTTTPLYQKMYSSYF